MLFVVAAAAASAAPVDLRYKYTKGDRLEYKAQTNIAGKVVSKFPRTDAPVETPLDMSMTMTLSQFIKDVDEKKQATIETTFERMVMKQGEKVLIDATKDTVKESDPMAMMFKKPFVVVMDDRGRVESMQGMEDLTKMMPSMDMSMMMNQSQQPFPDHLVNVGDSWDFPLPEMLGGAPGGAGDQKITYTFTGIEKVKERECAKIGMVFSADMKEIMAKMLEAAPSTGATVNKMDISYSGDMYFDIEAGVIIAVDFVMDLDSTMTMKDPTGNTPPSEVATTMNMKAVYTLQ